MTKRGPSIRRTQTEILEMLYEHDETLQRTTQAAQEAHNALSQYLSSTWWQRLQIRRRARKVAALMRDRQARERAGRE